MTPARQASTWLWGRWPRAFSNVVGAELSDRVGRRTVNIVGATGMVLTPGIERTVAVLPVAATEQHGPHLPVSVDATLLQGVIDAALPLLPPELPVLFLPPQNVGLSPEHIRFPEAALTLAPATLIALWTELGEGVARAGIKKLLLFSSHGGQVSVMDIVARRLRSRCGLLVYSASWFSLPLPNG